MSTYVTGTDMAKIARAILKEAFPGIKFSVRTCRSTGTLNIGWTDGPIERDVRDKVGILAGKCVDWTGDYTDYTDDLPVVAFTGAARKLAEKLANGDDKLSMGSGFVFTNRGYSAESWQLAGAEILEQRGVTVQYNIRGEIVGTYEPEAWLRTEDGFCGDSYSWNAAALRWLATIAR
jgi:hypothetical protein